MSGPPSDAVSPRHERRLRDLKPRPDKAVLAYVVQTRASSRITAITKAELLFGLERMPRGRRRDTFAASLGAIMHPQSRSVLPFDGKAAEAYAKIAAGREKAGRPISAADAQIAAICKVRTAVLATRSVKGFAGTGIEIVNPWDETALEDPPGRRSP